MSRRHGELPGYVRLRRVIGSVALFQRVFKIRITEGTGDDPPVRTYSTTARVRLPSDLRPLVQDVFTSYLRQVKVSAPRVAAAHALAVAGGVGGDPRPPTRTGTWTGGCAQAEAAGAFSYDQVRDAYGIDQLGTGAGASIVILALTEVPSARDIADNLRCFAYQRLKSRTLLTESLRARRFRSHRAVRAPGGRGRARPPTCRPRRDPGDRATAKPMAARRCRHARRPASMGRRLEDRRRTHHRRRARPSRYRYHPERCQLTRRP